MYRFIIFFAAVVTGAQYEPRDQYGKGKGYMCDMCPPGTQLSKECSSDGLTPTNCVPCQDGTYTSFDHHMSKCIRCDDCAGGGRIEESKCTLTSNVQCTCPEGQWLAGEYCMYWTECESGEFESEKGTATSDRVCTRCPDGQFSNGNNECHCPPEKVQEDGKCVFPPCPENATEIVPANEWHGPVCFIVGTLQFYGKNFPIDCPEGTETPTVLLNGNPVEPHRWTVRGKDVLILNAQMVGRGSYQCNRGEAEGSVFLFGEDAVTKELLLGPTELAVKYLKLESLIEKIHGGSVSTLLEFTQQIKSSDTEAENIKDTLNEIKEKIRDYIHDHLDSIWAHKKSKN